ncbi:hypothetical protein SDC9_210631 [bioreactor metagenome]|uniref:Uncharacterized protein n=1 Tax=bioreactor metagenome TaxID=1076179 RepID=A0A645JGQ0_9ZZZZ
MDQYPNLRCSQTLSFTALNAPAKGEFPDHLKVKWSKEPTTITQITEAICHLKIFSLSKIITSTSLTLFNHIFYPFAFFI